MTTEFQPPPFRTHPLVRGGHLQTIVSVGSSFGSTLAPKQHRVGVSDGDCIVLHEDRPTDWRTGDPSILLVHGLTGCHGAPYMLRLAHRFTDRGYCVFRMDMRGCGVAAGLARNLTHAGRSDDIMAALAAVAEITQDGPIGAVGVSLGANQLLRAVGRVGAGLDPTPDWFERLTRISAVAPPLDLQRCADNLERWVLRPYNYYFIRALLARAPAQVRERAEYQQAIASGRPKTLRELDDRITAPLSGFDDASDYYARASAKHVTQDVGIRCLVLTARDDPLIPLGCFVDDPKQWSDCTRLVVARSGGHVGFIARGKEFWMDEVLAQWFG